MDMWLLGVTSLRKYFSLTPSAVEGKGHVLAAFVAGCRAWRGQGTIMPVEFTLNT